MGELSYYLLDFTPHSRGFAFVWLTGNKKSHHASMYSDISFRVLLD